MYNPPINKSKNSILTSDNSNQNGNLIFSQPYTAGTYTVITTETADTYAKAFLISIPSTHLMSIFIGSVSNTFFVSSFASI